VRRVLRTRQSPLETTMLRDLTPDEKHLADLMSDISEKCCCAGWMLNLEYVLWNAVITGPCEYGHGTITSRDIDELVRASEKLKSWIVFDDELEEIAVPLDKWRIKFADDIKEHPDKLRG
jgi:hypothetical protein